MKLSSTSQVLHLCATVRHKYGVQENIKSIAWHDLDALMHQKDLASYFLAHRSISLHNGNSFGMGHIHKPCTDFIQTAAFEAANNEIDAMHSMRQNPDTVSSLPSVTVVLYFLQCSLNHLYL